LADDAFPATADGYIARTAPVATPGVWTNTAIQGDPTKAIDAGAQNAGDYNMQVAYTVAGAIQNWSASKPYTV
jgi:hypothetical protein